MYTFGRIYVDTYVMCISVYMWDVYIYMYIVLSGGTNCWENVFKSVYRYDFIDNKLYDIPSMKNERYGHSMISMLNRYLFIVGGCNRDDNVLQTEFYDRMKNKWDHNIGNILKPMNRCQCLRYENNIYLVSNLNKYTQYYDINNQKWYNTGDLNYYYPNGNKLTTFDYKLLCMSKTNIYNFEIFNQNTGKWVYTDIKNHPIYTINNNYTNNDIKKVKIIDWYHLGRRYW